MDDNAWSWMFGPVWIFLCVLSRTGPLLALMPPIRGSTVPNRVRVLMALMLAGAVTPLVLQHATPLPSALPLIAIALAKELLLGILLGTAIQVVMTGLQLGGQIMSTLASMDIAEAADPMTQEQTSVINQLLSLLAMALFLAMGGHRQLLACCLDSFALYPAGAVMTDGPWLSHVGNLLQHSLEIGIRAAAPAAIALLLANLITALIGRTLPQLNIMAIGFNLNIAVLLVMLTLSIGSLSWVFQSELTQWIESTHELLSEDAARG